MFLLVFLVLFINDLNSPYLELPIEFDNRNRVDDNTNPKTGQFVLRSANSVPFYKPFTNLFHANEPDHPSEGHCCQNEANYEKPVLNWSLVEHLIRLLTRFLLDEEGGTRLIPCFRPCNFLISLFNCPNVLEDILFALPALNVDGGPKGEHDEVGVVPLGV